MKHRPLLRSVWLGSVPGYRPVWALQRRLAQARRRGELTSDCLILVEHDPVYTLGRNTAPTDVGLGEARLRELGADYVEVDRGGSVTFHGPGQLVAYPIVRLAGVFPQVAAPGIGDVMHYVRALEAAAMAVAAVHGVVAERRPPHTGVWVGRDKLAAVGVKVAGGVTSHGVALNVATDLNWFGNVVACGIPDAGATSLARAAARPLTVIDMIDPFSDALAAVLTRERATPDATLSEIIEAELGLPVTG